MPPKAQGAKNGIRAHLYNEPAAITGRDTLPTTAAGAVDMKLFCRLAVVAIAVGISLRNFGGTFRWHF